MIYYGGNNLPAKLRSKRRRAAKIKSLKLSGDFNISIAYTRPEKTVLQKPKTVEPKAAKPVGIKPAAVKPTTAKPAAAKTEKKAEQAKAVKQPKEVKPVSEKPAVKTPEKAEKAEKAATEEVKAVKPEKKSEEQKVKAAETEKTAKKEKSPAAVKKETKETEKPAVEAKTSKTADKKAETKPEAEVKAEKEEKTEPAVKAEEIPAPAVEEPKAEEVPAAVEEVKAKEIPAPAVEETKTEEIPAVTEEVKAEEVPAPAVEETKTEEVKAEETSAPAEKPADDGKFKLDPTENADILSKMATKRARKLIYAPKEALYEITGIKIDVEGKKNDKGVKVKDILEAEIKEGLKLGYLDKYDGLKTSEIKEEYENDTVWELAEQEFKKMGMLLDGDKIKVYVYDFTGTGCHHIGYVPETEAKDIIPYLKDMDKYSFDLCGIITGGKSKTVTKDPKTGKITITKGKDGNYGVDLDVTIINRKD